jgi:two-component sensor histidine kinase
MNLYKLKGRFKGFLFVSALLLILLLMFYTQKVVNDLREESREIIKFYASLYARIPSEENDSSISFIFEQIIQRTHFPIILTDAEHNPTGWQGIGISPDDDSPETLERVRGIMHVLANEAEPLPLKYEETTFNYLYYGDSELIKQLQRLPYVGISVIGLFVMVGFFGFKSIQRSEQQFIWVGMSKETAHQIGTPLSSLMGWIALLKTRIRSNEAKSTLLEMEKDLDRLSKIATRFSQIGSKTDLKETDIDAVIHEVAGYFQRRLPQWGKRIEIKVESTNTVKVALNRDLFEWVLENLLKNAIDAIKGKNGMIQINVTDWKPGKQKVVIDVKDTGTGMPSSQKKEIFKPGFSTKKRGWGLGLSLAKRIVEDYHHGKLFVKETKPGMGTTMRIII